MEPIDELPCVFEGMLFMTLDHSVYEPGTVVEAIGLDRGLYLDSTHGEEPALDDRPYLWARSCHDSIDEWWYFTAKNLKPLTNDAAEWHDELKHAEKKWRKKWGKAASR